MQFIDFLYVFIECVEIVEICRKLAKKVFILKTLFIWKHLTGIYENKDLLSEMMVLRRFDWFQVYSILSMVFAHRSIFSSLLLSNRSSIAVSALLN